jgi:hypothetical protein
MTSQVNGGLPLKPHHWLMAAVLFGLLILWVVPVDAAALAASASSAAAR